MHHHAAVQTDSLRPIAEVGVSETVHSIAWFKHEQKCMVIGANNKQLKIVDFRGTTERTACSSLLYIMRVNPCFLLDSAKVINTAATKAVYNVSVNPHNNYHLVSSVDNQITIWDTRCFEKPVLTLSQARQITKVQWCPTRHNLLGALQKDSGRISFLYERMHGNELLEIALHIRIIFIEVTLHLYDIQHCGIGGGEDTEPGALERTVAPLWHSPVSFSWHPTHVNRLLAISQQGLIILHRYVLTATGQAI